MKILIVYGCRKKFLLRRILFSLRYTQLFDYYYLTNEIRCHFFQCESITCYLLVENFRLSSLSFSLQYTEFINGGQPRSS